MVYVEHDEVKNRKWFDTEKFLDIHQVKFTGFRCPRPLFTFEHANFPDFIKNVLKSQEETYSKPTAMQCMSWPVLLSGRDLIAVSNSGYGKHLAYMLPALVHVHNHKTATPDIKGPIVIVLTPYNPPKDDIISVIKPFCDEGNIKFLCIYEREDDKIDEQVENLKKFDYDILIANPIRLVGILEKNQDLREFNEVTYLVIDEYIQFRKTQTMDFVKNIVDYLRHDRQTAVFSKLVPSGIQRQGDEFIKNCIFFEMHHDKESANDEIKQIVELCDKYLKTSRLVEIVDKLTAKSDAKILIYAKDKEKCLNLNYELKRQLDLDVLDFRKEENLFVTTPNCVMTTFKNIGLEIAIPDLQYIINVDFPPNLQTYMDRLRKGIVNYTLFCREDAKHAERLIYSLKQARQEYDQSLVTMSKAWLECGRDLRFMPTIEDIQRGISKPLQEMMFSSGDEDSSPSPANTSLTGSFRSDIANFYQSFSNRSSFSSSYGKRNDDLEDEEDEDEDDEDFIDND